MITIDIHGMQFTFVSGEGWKAAGSYDPKLLFILNDLWETKYGFGGAAYYLTEEQNHLDAVIKLFHSKIILDTRTPLPTEPGVTY